MYAFSNPKLLYFRSKIKGKGRFTYTKKTWLVTPLHNWPSIDKSGLSMLMDRSINSTEDVQYFVYHHNASYKKIQLQFLHAVESSNPENIIVSITVFLMPDFFTSVFFIYFCLLVCL